jgi:TDG/mug DNA glycosylase family protein
VTPYLPDHLAPGLRILFVGINPGMRSAATGHHFAGFSNRFWPLLAESGLVPERLTPEADYRLPEWGLGLTNLVARPTPGVGDLRPADYQAGWRVLDRKIRRYQPGVVALVGVTVYRAILPLLAGKGAGSAASRAGRRPAAPGPVLGVRPETIHGARVFVLPNPSGRNANYSYLEMLEWFRALRRFTAEREAPR